MDELPHSSWAMSEEAREIESELLENKRQRELRQSYQEQEEDPFSIHRSQGAYEDEDDENRFGVRRHYDEEDEDRFGVSTNYDDEEDRFGVRRDDEDDDLSKFNIEREEIEYSSYAAEDAGTYDYGVMDTASYAAPLEVEAVENPFAKYMVEDSNENANRHAFVAPAEEEEDMGFLWDAPADGVGVAGSLKQQIMKDIEKAPQEEEEEEESFGFGGFDFWSAPAASGTVKGA